MLKFILLQKNTTNW